MVRNNSQHITTTPDTIKIIFGVLAGLVAYSIIGSFGLYLLKISWADYAISSKDKSYTFTMLLSRLFIGVFASVSAGISTARITKDKGKSAWFVGSIVCCVAAYIHFVNLWADYPAWYHFAYLFSIMPIVALSHYIFYKRK